MDTAANESKVNATAVNLSSKLLIAELSQITCPVHERCNGSCQSDGPIEFEAPCYGEVLFNIQLRRENETSTLPLEPTLIPMPTDAFRYSTIDSNIGQVRLLRIQPAVFLADPVRIELINAMLDNPPEYTALSYYWGPPLFDYRIVCNGKLLHVNKSLHEALKRHRQEVMCASGQAELLWADAICINQKDEEELNEQVLLMRQIYHKAERVVVDLGDVPLEWCFAVDLMNRAELVKQAIKPDSSKWHFSLNLPPEHFGLPPFDHGVWRMYFHIFSSAWFFRTWIIQEVSLARTIFVRSGRFTFEWGLLWGPYAFFHKNARERSELGPVEAVFGYLNLQKILLIRNLFHRKVLTPIKLLDLARDFKVSKPRDKIIGLIGLFPQGDKIFRPDHSWSEGKLSHEFAIYVIGNAIQPHPWGSEDRKALLSHAGLQWQPDGYSSPSWAPDWTAQSRYGPEAFITIRRRPYATATPHAKVHGQIAEVSRPAADLFVLEDEPGLLCVLSFRADTIAATSPAFSEAKDQRLDDQWRLWHNDVQRVFRNAALQGNLRYADPEAAFACTLLAGETYSGADAVWNFSTIDDPSAARLSAITSPNTSHDPVTATYLMQTVKACKNRKFAITSNGCMGLVPGCSEIGDSIYLFSGFSVPFVLREHQNGHFVLVGDAYIHGIMEGETWTDGKVKWPDNWTPVVLC